MKKTALTILLFFTSIVSFCQFPAFPDSVYNFIKRNSVFRNTVDWSKTDAAFHSCIASAKTISDTLHCFVGVFKMLNDVHSHFIYNNRYYGHYNPVEDSVYKRIKPIKERAESVAGKFYTTILDKKYGYVMVPSISAYGNEQVNLYAQALYDSVCKFSSPGIKGFIIDLRLNSGGNMYPMLSGLSSLLGNSIIGYETDIDNSTVRSWEIKDNNFIIGGYPVTEIKKTCGTDNTKMPVVVLIGPLTGSSGSMTAIAFKQRPGTRFIGEPTADGYTTSNGFFRYPPNLSINLACNFVADRKMNVYKRTVDPDVMIHGADNFDGLMNDEKIKLALAWLAK